MSIEQPQVSSARAAAPPEPVVRLLRRRHRWALTGYWLAVPVVIFLVISGGVVLFGQPAAPGLVASVLIGGFGVLAVLAFVFALVLGRGLRGIPAETRAQADEIVRAERDEFRKSMSRSRRRRRGRVGQTVRAPGQRPRYGWGILVLVCVSLGCLTGSAFTEPGLVNAVGYLTGASPTGTFVPQSYGQSCNKGGCHTITDGVLKRDGKVVLRTDWPAEVPLGQPFSVRAPIWGWGTGTELTYGDGKQASLIMLGLFVNALTGLFLWATGGVLLERRRWPTA